MAFVFGGALQAQSLFVDSAVEGAWYDPATSGQGVMIESLPGGRQLFVTWFTFAPDDSGAQRWYSAVLTVNGSLATGPMHRTTGGRLNATPPASQQQKPVGSMSIDFPDCRTASVSYTLADEGAARSGHFVATPARELVPGAPACTAVTKMRWPHAAPTLDAAGYDRLQADLFLPNNFGQHQGGVAERPGDTYFHDGIDIFTANGDPIYALEAGTVRSISLEGTNGSTVTIEDDDTPGEGWSYVHIVPVVAPGAKVEAGQRLGTVQFTGLAHLHLSRVRKPASASDWTFVKLLTLNPIGFFEVPDSEPPLFRDGLIFLRDLTDTRIPDGTPVSGKVDILAGMRDAGPAARRSFGGGTPYTTNHGILWAEYDIEGPGVKTTHRAFDFNRLQIGRPQPSVWSMTPLAQVVYQPILRVDIAGTADRAFNYYRLTNGTGGDTLSLQDGLQSWDTAAKNAVGERVYPDGSYTITVRAADAAGNIAQYSDSVDVRND